MSLVDRFWLGINTDLAIAAKEFFEMQMLLLFKMFCDNS